MQFYISGCSAVGSAPALGAGCRVFESPHSDQIKPEANVSGFFVLLLNGGDTVIHAVMLCGNFILLAFDDFVSSFFICSPLGII